MSRIGKQPVPIPEGVEVNVADLVVSVKGPKGDLSVTMPTGIAMAVVEREVVCTRADDSATSRSRHGLVRTLIANMIEGVTAGYAKRLELVGVGYRAQSQGKDIEVQVGFSHPVTVSAPDGITFDVPAQNQIVVSGIDKVLVGQTAANIRGIRPPEPYKGKGIRYEGEHVRRKAGKAAAK